jgi:hypothetical protein
MNSEKPKTYSMQMNLVTALKFGKNMGRPRKFGRGGLAERKKLSTRLLWKLDRKVKTGFIWLRIRIGIGML